MLMYDYDTPWECYYIIETMTGFIGVFYTGNVGPIAIRHSTYYNDIIDLLIYCIITRVNAKFKLLLQIFLRYVYRVYTAGQYFIDTTFL